MTISVTGPDVAEAAGARIPPGDTRRVVTRRRSRPDRRAILGGLLVAGSALGLLVLGRLDRGPDQRPYLVITRELNAGHRLVAEDLGLASMHLHPDTAVRALDDPKAAIGQETLLALRPGDLLLDSAIAPAGTGTAGNGRRRVGLELDPADALNGDLDSGARVDVVAVDDDGAARTIALDALVTGVGGSDETAVGSAGTVRLTIEVADAETARAVVAAAAHDQITLLGGGGR